MISKKILVIIFFLLLLVPNANGNNKSLIELDKIIESNDSGSAQYEHKLSELKKILYESKTKEDEYEANMDLYRAYQPFSLDSALNYLNRGIVLADELGNNERIIDTQLSRAFLYCYSGQFKEAADILKEQNVDGCSEWLRISYFHLAMTINQYLSEFAIDKKLADYYRSISECARDSVLSHLPNDTILIAERMSSTGNYQGAINLLKDKYKDGQTDREAGIAYYVLSEIFAKQNNISKQKEYLAMAAKSDILNSIREYIALRKLAIILYEEGDVERAYRYIKRCIDDANASNSRIRILEVSSVLPIINEAYEKSIESKNQKLTFTIGVISILAILLILSLIIVARQMRKVSIAKQRQSETNEKLNSAYEEQTKLNEELNVLNKELRASNEIQTALNHRLSDSNMIKNTYIIRFMNLCSEYLSKMEKYRKSLNKVASKRNFDLLYEAVSSTRFIHDEINSFYKTFDEAFLNIFPDFIPQLNKLLIPEERITETKKLNTELRIFALYRLGITDSNIITEFLRCSSSTLYNYRVKMKNKAIDREQFEQDIMNIN